MATDWEILSCIVYHLVSNSIKHGSKNTEVILYAETETVNDKKFLKFQVSNLVDRYSEDSWRKLMQPQFAFQRIGFNKDETKGVGIGISTAT